MSNTPPEPPLTPLPPGYPPPWDLPTDRPGGGIDLGAAQHQMHLAWSRATLAFGHKLPVGLNKMTFYRARLKKVVS